MTCVPNPQVLHANGASTCTEKPTRCFCWFNERLIDSLNQTPGLTGYSIRPLSDADNAFTEYANKCAEVVINSLLPDPTFCLEL